MPTNLKMPLRSLERVGNSITGLQMANFASLGVKFFAGLPSVAKGYGRRRPHPAAKFALIEANFAHFRLQHENPNTLLDEATIRDLQEKYPEAEVSLTWSVSISIIR